MSRPESSGGPPNATWFLKSQDAHTGMCSADYLRKPRRGEAAKPRAEAA